MNNLPDTLTETIKDDNFQDVITDLGETAIDAILDEGVVRNIPLLGSFWTCKSDNVNSRQTIH